MKPPIFVRTLSKKERKALEEGLRSKDAFVLRRCQILLASACGEIAPQIAENLGCASQTVRDAIHDFNRRGVDALVARSSRPKQTHTAFGKEQTEALKELLHHSRREFARDSTLWTLEMAAQVSFEEGITHKRVSAETIRATCYLGAPWQGLAASQALDREPRSGVRPKKGDRDRLIRLAWTRPEWALEWALGFEDETWFSRFERPSLHSWADAGKPVHLLEKEARKDDPEPKALSSATDCICRSLRKLG